MSPFERFGIKHLSPSSLNLFQASPALWCGRYLFQWNDEAGPAAKRGGAVEAGLDVFLFGDRNDAQLSVKAGIVALDNFALNTHGVADDSYEKERAFILPMLGHAMIALKDIPKPVARQIKIECWLDGVDVPVIGYIDYLWEDGLLDLKTTQRIPSELKGDHARQVSLYWKVRQRQASILYVSDKKSSRLTLIDKDAELHLIDLTRAARCLQHALSRAENKNDLARFYVPDFDNFRWSPETRKLASEMYAPII